MQLKPHQHLHTHRRYTPEWYDFRQTGLGGSDLGAVMRINPYHSVWSLWEEKIGLANPNKELNEAMLYGLLLEDTVGRMWCMYDDMIDGNKVPTYVGRYAAYEQAVAVEPSTKISQFYVRRNHKVNGIITNDNFPWLFISLDRIIPKGQFCFKEGRPLLEVDVPLEIKTMNYYVANKFIDDIPPYYHTQGHGYMVVLEVDYVEFAVLVGGQRFSLKPFIQDEDFTEALIDTSHDFWYQHVLPGRDAVKMMRHYEEAGDWSGVDAMRHKLRELEPDADGSQHYVDWLTEKAKTEDIEGTATLDNKRNTVIWNHGIEYKLLGEVIKSLEAGQTERKAKILEFMRDSKISKIDFGVNGYISWKETKSSDKKRFNNMLKFEIAKDWVDGQVATITFEDAVIE